MSVSLSICRIILEQSLTFYVGGVPQTTNIRWQLVNRSSQLFEFTLSSDV